MVKILIFIFFIVFYIYPVFIYWIFRMKNPYTLSFLFGKMGVGKSGLITKYALSDLVSKDFKKVYTSIGVPGTYKFDPADIGKGFTFEPYSSIYIDEMGLVYNSRDFKSFPKEAREWFKYLRQSKCKVTIFSQSPDIDKSIRDLAHFYGILRRVGPIVILFDVAKNIDVGQDIEGNGQLIDNYFKLGILGGIHFYYLPRYFGLWDSFDPPYKPLIESEYMNPTPTLIRALSFKKWFKSNLIKVYDVQIAGISRYLNALTNKYIHTILLTNKKFIKLQFFNIRKEVYKDV